MRVWMALMMSASVTLAKVLGQGHALSPCGSEVLSAVGRLTIPNNFCTGVLISRTRVVTAAHCVWEDGASVANISFAPGVSYGAEPFGRFVGARATVPIGYDDTEDSSADVAVVDLLAVVPEAVGVGRLPVLCRDGYVNVTIGGYTAELIPECRASLCRVYIDCQAMYGEHDCDTLPGFSGAPLLDDVHRIVGVHVGAADNTNRFIVLSAPLMGKR